MMIESVMSAHDVIGTLREARSPEMVQRTNQMKLTLV
jgi:hypothetical protein